MTKTLFLFALFLSVNFISYIAAAGDLSNPDKEAMDKTVDLMNNKAERAKVIKDDENMKKVDKDVTDLAGTEQNKDAMYSAASKIFQDMVKEANGDPIKMQELMQKAQSDPKKFMESLSGANQNLIRGIANDIEKTKVDSKTP